MKSRSMMRAAVLVALGAVGAPTPVATAQDAVPEVQQREAVANELARIDAAFRIDGDAAAARRALEALLEAPETASLVEGDPKLSYARDELRQRLDITSAPSDASLEEAVLDAVNRWDMATLEQFGERGLSVVSQRLVASAGTSGPEPRRRADDPYRLLGVLLRLAPQQGAVLAKQQVTAGHLSAARVVGWLGDPLEAAWSNVPGGRPELMVPELLDLFLLGLAKAKTSELDWGSVCFIEKVLAERDAFGPEFIEAFTTHVLQSGRSGAVQALGAIDEDMQWPSVQPFYERMLQHPDPHVRTDAAERLSHYRDSAALRAHAGDSSREVRRLAALLLRPKTVNTPSWPSRNSKPEKTPFVVAPDDGPELRSILAKLSQDEDPLVREAAVTSLGQLSPPIDRAVLERVAKDPDTGVRGVLASILDPANSDDAALLKVLVGSGDPVIVSADRLHPMLWGAAHDPAKGDEVLSILKAIPAGRARTSLVQSIGSVLVVESAEGRKGLTRWALESGDPELLQTVIRPIQPGDVEQYRRQLTASWLDLEPTELTRLYPMVAELDPNLFPRLWNRAPSEQPLGLAPAMRLLFEDSSQPTEVRMAAGVAAARQLDSTLEAELLEFVSGPALRELHVELAGNFLRAFGQALPEPERNRVLLALLERSSPPGGILPYAIAEYLPYGPNGMALTEAILRQWGPESTGNEQYALQKAFEHAGTLRGQLDPQLLVAATRNPNVASYSIDAMCRQRDPVFLPTLAECLDASWLERENREFVSDEAARAVTAYMSDDAVRILLQAAAETSNSDLRQNCLSGVDTIRRFQDSMAEWERRDGSRATRDDAVGTLVGMLDDASPEVRAEALRGLVSLRAVEYLPRIIEGLKDEDAGVREAARMALEQHHRLEATERGDSQRGEPPSGAASDGEEDGG